MKRQFFQPWESVVLSLGKNVRYEVLISLVDGCACACRPRGGGVKVWAYVGKAWQWLVDLDGPD